MLLSSWPALAEPTTASLSAMTTTGNERQAKPATASKSHRVDADTHDAWWQKGPFLARLTSADVLCLLLSDGTGAAADTAAVMGTVVALGIAGVVDINRFAAIRLRLLFLLLLVSLIVHILAVAEGTADLFRSTVTDDKQQQHTDICCTHVKR